MGSVHKDSKYDWYFICKCLNQIILLIDELGVKEIDYNLQNIHRKSVCSTAAQDVAIMPKRMDQILQYDLSRSIQFRRTPVVC